MLDKVQRDGKKAPVNMKRAKFNKLTSLLLVFTIVVNMLPMTVLAQGNASVASELPAVRETQKTADSTEGLSDEVTLAIEPLKDICVENGERGFEVVAECNSKEVEITYQWQKLDVSIHYNKEIETGNVWEDLDMETSKELSFENVSDFSSYKDILFRCVVKAEEKIAYTNSARLLENKKDNCIDNANDEFAIVYGEEESKEEYILPTLKYVDIQGNDITKYFLSEYCWGDVAYLDDFWSEPQPGQMYWGPATMHGTAVPVSPLPLNYAVEIELSTYCSDDSSFYAFLMYDYEQIRIRYYMNDSKELYVEKVSGEGTVSYDKEANTITVALEPKSIVMGEDEYIAKKHCWTLLDETPMRVYRFVPPETGEYYIRSRSDEGGNIYVFGYILDENGEVIESSQYYINFKMNLEKGKTYYIGSMKEWVDDWPGYYNVIVQRISPNDNRSIDIPEDALDYEFRTLVTAVNVTKKWADGNANHKDDSVTIQLYANGQKVEGKALTLNAECEWKGTFDELAVNNDEGRINYTIEEVGPADGSRVTYSCETSVDDVKLVRIPYEKLKQNDVFAVVNEHIDEDNPSYSSIYLLYTQGQSGDDGDVYRRDLPLTVANTEMTFDDFTSDRYVDITQIYLSYDGGPFLEPFYKKVDAGMGRSYLLSMKTGKYLTMENQAYNSPIHKLRTTNKVGHWIMDYSLFDYYYTLFTPTLSDGFVLSCIEQNDSAEDKRWVVYRGGEMLVEDSGDIDSDDLELYFYVPVMKAELNYTVTNKPKLDLPDAKIPSYAVVNATKQWMDDDDHSNDNVTVHLLADGIDTGKTAVLNEENGWECSFTGLDYYNFDGEAIKYSLSEDEVKGYRAVVTEEESETIKHWIMIDAPDEIEDAKEYVIIGSDWVAGATAGDLDAYRILADSDGTFTSVSIDAKEWFYGEKTGRDDQAGVTLKIAGKEYSEFLNPELGETLVENGYIWVTIKNDDTWKIYNQKETEYITLQGNNTWFAPDYRPYSFTTSMMSGYYGEEVFQYYGMDCYGIQYTQNLHFSPSNIAEGWTKISANQAWDYNYGTPDQYSKVEAEQYLCLDYNCQPAASANGDGEFKMFTSISETTYNLKLTNEVITDTEIKHDKVTINKTNEDNIRINGATFTVYSDNACTMTVTSFTAGSYELATDNAALSNYLPEPGKTNTLYLKETKAPSGYQCSDEIYELVIETSETSAWNSDHSKYVTTTTYTITIDNNDNLTVVNNSAPVPDTGDRFNLPLWNNLMVVSGLGLMMTVIFDKKRRRNLSQAK